MSLFSHQRKLEPLGNTYESIYKEMKGSIIHIMDLGIDVPEVFRLAAKYTLTHKLEKTLSEADNFSDKKIIEKI